MNDATNKTEEPKAEQDSEKESEGQEITEDLASALEQEKERADRNLANWQRAQADLSNYKKRVDQEKQDLAKFANAALIGSMLNLVDDFQRARSTIPESILGMTWVGGPVPDRAEARCNLGGPRAFRKSRPLGRTSTPICTRP